jgi:hypothetical protein
VPTIWFPKLKLPGERDTPGDVPVPLREMVCGLPAALSVTETVPLALPVIVGVKVTFTVQELPAARLDPQLLVSEKPELAVIPEIVSAAVPVFVTVTG